MNRKLITAALVALTLAGFGVYRYDAQAVAKAREALARDVDAAARGVAGNYATIAHLELWSECTPVMKFTDEQGMTVAVPTEGKAKAVKPYIVRLESPNTPLPPLRDFVAEVKPCFLSGTSVAAMQPAPPADPEQIARTRLKGPYRVTKVAVDTSAPDTVRVAVEARAGLFGHSISGAASAGYEQYLVPQDAVTAALWREWQPVIDGIARKLNLPPLETQKPTPTQVSTPDPPEKRKPVQPVTGDTVDKLATEGIGIPPEVASGRVTMEEYCINHPELRDASGKGTGICYGFEFPPAAGGGGR